MATQEKTWNVANRMHSQKDSDNPEVNHIIAGADEIYDDEKGAKQSDINAQTDAALADRYTKAETYSKEQVDSLITTPDVNYVTVMATNATTSVTDILPATGEANTIYRVGNWNGTQFDSTMYALFAWNGSAYVCLSVRSFVGEVYDVSVNHPDGQGNPTPYADLTAALGTDGENIPADIRRGGMRIQFIKGNAQSSDNKYVQFRCKTPSFSTNPEEWAFEGDDTLVKSHEWLIVATDSNSKILYGVKIDGKFYFGDGCPPQVKEYVLQQIDEIDALLATKVDKVTGKSLIDTDFALAQEVIDNKEWLHVEIDSESRILEGIRKDGKKVQNLPIKTLLYEEDFINNSEWLDVKTGKFGEIIEGIRKDGSKYIPKLNAPDLKSKESHIGSLYVEQLELNKSNIERLKGELGVDYIKTNSKYQEFSLLFKDAGGEVESFVFFSDPHYFTSYNECSMKDGALEYIKQIKDAFDNTPTDFVLCGGDWLTSHKQSVAIKDLGWVDGFMNNLFPDKYYPVYGNHDDNYQGELDTTSDTSANDGILSNQQMVNLWFRKWGKMYYSFKGSNTKFYVFDTGLDGAISSAMNSYKWEQVDWFANELINNSDSHIIIALHIVQMTGQTFGDNVTPITDNVLKVAEAFNARTSITLNGETYNFANSQGKVHAAICGHTHYDATAVINNIPVYCIKDAQEGAFDLLLLDYSNSKLKSVRIGYGNNREMNLI